jgi:hypothetical protein
MFSCFALPDMFSRDAEDVGSRFHILRSRTHFWRFRVRRVPFSCFALIGHVFGGTEGVRSRFHVLCSGTHFRRCGGRRVPFSCFVLPDSFSALPRASGPVFMFSLPDMFSRGAEDVGSHFHILRSRTHFRLFRVRRVPVSCFALIGHFFGGTEGVRSRFHVLCSETHFWRCGGCRVPFSCFASPYSFSAVARAWGPVLMFCDSGLVFGGNERVGSRFHVLRSRTSFRRYGGRQVLFSCFALQDSFSAVARASGPVFMFCTPGLVFGDTEGVECGFHFLHDRTHFGRYRRHWVPFSCFGRPD